jgi:hypothetical protein
MCHEPTPAGSLQEGRLYFLGEQGFYSAGGVTFLRHDTVAEVGLIKPELTIVKLTMLDAWFTRC